MMSVIRCCESFASSLQRPHAFRYYVKFWARYSDTPSARPVGTDSQQRADASHLQNNTSRSFSRTAKSVLSAVCYWPGGVHDHQNSPAHTHPTQTASRFPPAHPTQPSDAPAPQSASRGPCTSSPGVPPASRGPFSFTTGTLRVSGERAISHVLAPGGFHLDTCSTAKDQKG